MITTIKRSRGIMNDSKQLEGIAKMVEILWRDVEDPNTGIKDGFIRLIATLDEREHAARIRRWRIGFLVSLATLIIGALSLYAAYWSHETAKHTGAITASSDAQQSATMQLGEK